jgi:hypothetical protein
MDDPVFVVGKVLLFCVQVKVAEDVFKNSWLKIDILLPSIVTLFTDSFILLLTTPPAPALFGMLLKSFGLLIAVLSV